jgi:hypothetical protein
MCATVSWGAHESFMYPIFVLKNGCDTCLDQSFPDDTADLAQNNTLDHQETAHYLYSIIKHQHIIIRAIIHEANKET